MRGFQIGTIYIGTINKGRNFIYVLAWVALSSTCTRSNGIALHRDDSLPHTKGVEMRITNRHLNDEWFWSIHCQADIMIQKLAPGPNEIAQTEEVIQYTRLRKKIVGNLTWVRAGSSPQCTVAIRKAQLCHLQQIGMRSPPAWVVKVVVHPADGTVVGNVLYLSLKG